MKPLPTKGKLLSMFAEAAESKGGIKEKANAKGKEKANSAHSAKDEVPDFQKMLLERAAQLMPMVVAQQQPQNVQATATAPKFQDGQGGGNAVQGRVSPFAGNGAAIPTSPPTSGAQAVAAQTVLAQAAAAMRGTVSTKVVPHDGKMETESKHGSREKSAKGEGLTKPEMLTQKLPEKLPTLESLKQPAKKGLAHEASPKVAPLEGDETSPSGKRAKEARDAEAGPDALAGLRKDNKPSPTSPQLDAVAAQGTQFTPPPEMPAAAPPPPPVALPPSLAEDATAQLSLMGHTAQLSLMTPENGPLNVHVQVQGGVADVRMVGTGSEMFQTKSLELSTALAGQGLSLGQLDVGQQERSFQNQRNAAEESREVNFDASRPRRSSGATRSVADTNSGAASDGRLHIKA